MKAHPHSFDFALLRCLLMVATVVVLSGCYDRLEGDAVVNTLNSPVVIRVHTEDGRTITNVVSASTHFVWTSEEGRAAFRVRQVEVEEENGRKIGGISDLSDPGLRSVFGKNLALAVYPNTVCPVGKHFFREYADRRIRGEEFPEYFKRRRSEIIEFYERRRRTP